MTSKLDRISELTSLVVGDVMIDAYLWGNVERQSPEAPVPVVLKTGKDSRIGGAGNVARNHKRKRIIPRHLQIAVRNDNELAKLLGGVTIAGGGMANDFNRVKTYYYPGV